MIFVLLAALCCMLCMEVPLQKWLATLACRGVHDPQHCSRCARTFNTNRTSPFVDLTLTSGVTSRVYKESLWGGVEIFRSDVASLLLRLRKRCHSTYPSSVCTLSLVLTLCCMTHCCRNPLVSFVYERGWRQGFAWAGFPGECR